MTTQDFASMADVSARTVQRWIAAQNKATGATHPFGLKDRLPEGLIVHLQERAGLKATEKPTPNNHEFKPREKPVPSKPSGADRLISILPILPLPMLGLAASYGVYFFASQFAPFWVAVGEAAAFELTYIGLSAMKNLTDKQQVVARRVSVGAVVVSVVYNSIAGVIHYDPGIIGSLSGVWLWVVAVVHGAPLAILAYFVADLIFHQKK